MPQDDRKDFESWKVDLVYKQQDGCCIKCGGTLHKGFHRHHKDKDHSNNNVENLELHCPSCHRGESNVKAHKDQEKRVLNNINKLIDESFESKMSGSTLQQLVEAMGMSMRISRSVNDLDTGIEYPSANITYARKMKAQEAQFETYVEGIKDGIKLVTKIIKEKE